MNYDELNTRLKHACQDGNVKLVRLLIQFGADSYRVPLWHALLLCNDKIGKRISNILIKNGANYKTNPSKYVNKYVFKSILEYGLKKILPKNSCRDLKQNQKISIQLSKKHILIKDLKTELKKYISY
jgi:hypothetical protein